VEANSNRHNKLIHTQIYKHDMNREHLEEEEEEAVTS
jgi:hypothetical protein